MNRTLKTRLGVGLAGGLLVAPVFGVTLFAHDVATNPDTTVNAACPGGDPVDVDIQIGKSPGIDLCVDPGKLI